MSMKNVCEENRKMVVNNYKRKMEKLMMKSIPPEIIQILIGYIPLVLINLLNKRDKLLKYDVISIKDGVEKYSFKTSYQVLQYDGGQYMHWRVAPASASWKHVWVLEAELTLTARYKEELPHKKKKTLIFTKGNRNLLLDDSIPGKYIKHGFGVEFDAEMLHVQKTKTN